MRRVNPDAKHTDVELDNMLKTYILNRKNKEFVDWEDTWLRFIKIVSIYIRRRHSYKTTAGKQNG